MSSPRPIVLNPDLKRLLDDGFEVEIRNGHLLLHHIPYVNAQRQVAQGILVTNLNLNLDEVLPPTDHQVWFVGDFPCRQDGTPIEGIRHTDTPQELWPGFQVQYRFSNKPAGGFPDYYSKMTSYARIIAHEAKSLDPNADPRTFKVVPPIEEDSVFRYHDSASSRADILAISAKLARGKVAIIGLGGTGSYVLDFVAKTPVQEIHLFDGDTFLQHNAFRAPGAAGESDLAAKKPKVIYFAEIYSAMRTGIVPHPQYLTAANLGEVAGMDFAFVCVDKGPVRKLICDYLQAKGIAFVDVGMDLQLGPEAANLIGTCRATLCTPEKSDHFPLHVPMAEGPEEDLYRKNIQVADLNAFNAALAVIKWKQLWGFYQDLFQAHHITYTVNSQSMTRDAMIERMGS